MILSTVFFSLAQKGGSNEAQLQPKGTTTTTPTQSELRKATYDLLHIGYKTNPNHVLVASCWWEKEIIDVSLLSTSSETTQVERFSHNRSSAIQTEQFTLNLPLGRISSVEANCLHSSPGGIIFVNPSERRSLQIPMPQWLSIQKAPTQKDLFFLRGNIISTYQITSRTCKGPHFKELENKIKSIFDTGEQFVIIAESHSSSTSICAASHLRTLSKFDTSIEDSWLFLENFDSTHKFSDFDFEVNGLKASKMRGVEDPRLKLFIAHNTEDIKDLKSLSDTEKKKLFSYIFNTYPPTKDEIQSGKNFGAYIHRLTVHERTKVWVEHIKKIPNNDKAIIICGSAHAKQLQSLLKSPQIDKEEV